MSHVGSQKDWFSNDRPLESSEQDLLGRAGFAETLAEAISKWQNKESVVIGLYGPWGSGKSSLKNFAIQKLREKEKRPHVIEFNPWRWKDLDDLAAVFFDALEAGLKQVLLHASKQDEGTDGDAKDAGEDRGEPYTVPEEWRPLLRLFGRYKWRLLRYAGRSLKASSVPVAATNPALAGSMAGLGTAAEVATDIGEALESRRSASLPNGSEEDPSSRTPLEAVKRRLSTEIRRLPTPILVVVDDVDRLEQREIVLLFQLIKATCDLPNMIYLVLCDRENVEAALETVASGRGSEYLRKIVQVPLNVPPIAKPDLDRLLIEELAPLAHLDQLEDNERARWEALYRRAVLPCFRSVRDIRRFMSSLTFYGNLLTNVYGGSRTNMVDLIGLETLRVFYPEVYQRISAHKEFLTSEESPESLVPTVASVLGISDTDDVTRMVNLDADLTPEFSIVVLLFPLIWSNCEVRRAVPAIDKDSPQKDHRVCYAEYFDGYFKFS